MLKTNVIRILAQHKIAYEELAYEVKEFKSGLDTVNALNLDPNLVFKTIVCKNQNKYFVLVIPVLKEIDLMQYLNPERITGYVKSVVGVATGLFDVFVTVVASAYLLLERGKILEYIKKIGYAILKEETCERIGEYCNTTNKVFFRFISSQLIDSILVGIVVTIAMSIIGVKYSILLGFIIGLFNLIPYFGAIVAVAISILITLVTGGLSQAIVMALVVIILQQIDANIINPKIIGTSLQISPLLVILSVTVGGGYFGVLGMFLAVPAVTVLKLILDDYLDFKNKKKMIFNDVEDN